MGVYKRLVVLAVMLPFSSAIAYSMSSTKEATCQAGLKPKTIRPLPDWEIIASNTAVIPTKYNFSGEELIYSVTAEPKSSRNHVSINQQTGEIHIQAEAIDKFDVKVKAKNPCGEDSVQFNVIIDEEE